MIQKYIDKFKEIENELLNKFTKQQPENYQDILVKTFELMFKDKEYEDPDISKLTVIDHGDYQGTILFVIPEEGYQPSTYFYIFVYYGSCSGCDTYEAYCEWEEENWKESAPHMVTMARHMIESMKKIGAYE